MPLLVQAGVGDLGVRYRGCCCRITGRGCCYCGCEMGHGQLEGRNCRLLLQMVLCLQVQRPIMTRSVQTVRARVS